MLLATLWNTGARINEELPLALTRGDFSLAPPYPFVQLATLKQRTEKAARTAGRAPGGSQVHRLVPLSDHQYVSPAADDGGHSENSAGKTKQAHR
ncbi:TPA: resolvase [Klebsiella quasipneumoniae subsp. similipneumoniae]|nr:resolvase [Klebsiella quasipneumoniae subsp. similipneumoniae]HBR5595905.1 resolvase [Klebsiella pneumoniae]HEK7382265.1 resolvase [Klebsiella pneumoniae]HEK7856314.1 resolvase [Klebsiella pneumoniae]HEK7978903.1 resolvase [Klebsiella pneumoniae]